MTYMCNACRKPVVPAEHVSVGGLIHHAACAAALTPKRSQCEAKLYNGIADMHPKLCVLPSGHPGAHQYIGGAALALLEAVLPKLPRKPLPEGQFHIPIPQTAEQLRAAGMVFAGAPSMAGRLEMADELMRDGKAITAEQYVRVLETGVLPDRIGSQPRPCFTCGKVQTVDDYNLCLDEMVSAGEFGDDRDGYVCSECESEVRAAVRAVKDSKICAKCKEPMRCSPMLLEDGRRMHPGCWTRIEPTQPLAHKHHHDAPQPGCHECHVKAHGELRGVKIEKVIIDEGGKLEPRKGAAMAQVEKKKIETIEDFIKEYGHAPKEAGDDEHCAICNVKAPRVLGFAPQFYRNGEPMLVVTLNGWMKIFYPWSDKWPEGTSWPEHANACPKCGKRVAEYVALLKDPGITEHDL